jgi:hypothetical protein
LLSDRAKQVFAAIFQTIIDKDRESDLEGGSGDGSISVDQLLRYFKRLAILYIFSFILFLLVHVHFRAAVVWSALAWRRAG